MPWLCKGRLFDPVSGTRTRRRHKQAHTWGQHSPVCTPISILTWPAHALAAYRCGWTQVGTQRSPGGKPQCTDRPVTWTKHIELLPPAQPYTGVGTWEGVSSSPLWQGYSINHQPPRGILQQHTRRQTGKPGFMSLLRYLSHRNRQFLTQVFLKTASYLLGASVSHLCKGLIFIALFYPSLSPQPTQISRQTTTMCTAQLAQLSLISLPSFNNNNWHTRNGKKVILTLSPFHRFCYFFFKLVSLALQIQD